MNNIKVMILILNILVFALFSCGTGEERTGEVTESQPAAPKSHRNVILIIIDTLRADHLSCYGYHRLTSPAIDSLAEAGTMLLNAYPQAPWTLPSHATIWTGLSVRSHRTDTNMDFQSGSSDGKNYALDTDLMTMPMFFQREGFATAGISNVVLLSSSYGFDEGFDTYYCHDAGHGMAGESVDSLICLIDSLKGQRMFCMLHLYDVHDPYYPPEVYRKLYDPGVSGDVTNWETMDGQVLNPQDRDELLALYDGEVAWVDENLRRLFNHIRSSGIADSTLVIVTSDHGEEFLEHGGVLHGHTLYGELLHVPLIMAGPGIEEGRKETLPVGLFDLLPTVLRWSGIECTAETEGEDILNDPPSPDRTIPASGTAFPVTPEYHLAAVIKDVTKTIGFQDLDRFIQFDLAEDPLEENPVQPDSMSMEEVLQYWATPPKGFPQLISPDSSGAAALEDLGYI